MRREKKRKQEEAFAVRLKKDFIRYRYIYLMLLPVVIYYAVFCYGPMSKIVIAFQNFKPALGISGSKWVGMKYFIDFFTGPYAWRLIRNTLLLNILLFRQPEQFLRIAGASPGRMVHSSFFI